MNKRRLRMQPDQRQAQIVQVARTIMVEQGAGAMTVRAVATGCDVSLAAVQHHFPDKDTLLKAVIESITAEYEQRYAEAISATVHEPEDRLRQFIEFLVCDDIKSAPTAGFFYELWLMAFRDPVAQDAMTRLYDMQLIRVRDMVQLVNIDLDERDALARAAIIVAAADGLMMTIGAGKDTVLKREPALEPELVDALMNVVRQPASGRQEADGTGVRRRR
jgi:AcrR family transcriptional regulator